MKTYEDYLEDCKAYRFVPLDRKTWEGWYAYWLKRRNPK